MIGAIDLCIIAALAGVAIVDAKRLIIPDTLTLFIAFAAALATYLQGQEAMLDGGLGALMAFVLFEGTRRVMSWRLKREAMGFGDVKLMTAGAIWIGAQSLSIAILIGCVSAALAFLIVGISRRANPRVYVLPFGPFLAFGLIGAKYSIFILTW